MSAADSFAEAGAIARDCAHDVEVVTERTPWQTYWATPNGETRLEASAIPTRVQAGDSWVDLDTTLVADPSSDVVKVAASTFPMLLSGGPTGSAGLSPSSTTPLGQIEREGRVLRVWFPLDLPVPDVSGSRASYALGEGIDLHVTINVDGTGFLPVVELADPNLRGPDGDIASFDPEDPQAWVAVFNSNVQDPSAGALSVEYTITFPCDGMYDAFRTSDDVRSDWQWNPTNRTVSFGFRRRKQ